MDPIDFHCWKLFVDHLFCSAEEYWVELFRITKIIVSLAFQHISGFIIITAEHTEEML